MRNPKIYLVFWSFQLCHIIFIRWSLPCNGIVDGEINIFSGDLKGHLVHVGLPAEVQRSFHLLMKIMLYD